MLKGLSFVGIVFPLVAGCASVVDSRDDSRVDSSAVDTASTLRKANAKPGAIEGALSADETREDALRDDGTFGPWSAMDASPVCAAGMAVSSATSIAHAGGLGAGKKYTNSLEALNESYAKGFRVFELDWSKTSDGAYVAVHDWSTWSKMTGLSGVPNKATFVATKLHGSLSPLTLDDVEGWLRAHGDTLVIADLKESPMEALAKIRWVTRVPGRWLPEVRSGLEIQLAKTLGLGGPILMTDLQTPSQDDVKTLVQKHNLRWVGFPLARFVVSPIVPWLHEQGALVLVHPVDDPLSRWAVQSRQGDAIYTTVAPSNAPCAIPSADAWAASLTRQAPSPNP